MDKKQILIGVAAVALILGGNVAATWFITSSLIQTRFDEAAAAEAAENAEEGVEEVVLDTRPPIYVSMKPFVVNYMQGESLRYLQMTVELMSRDEDVIEQVKSNIPQIRNALIMLLSSQSYEDFATREGKEMIRSLMHEEVNIQLPPDQGIESVFLTGFIMQ